MMVEEEANGVGSMVDGENQEEDSNIDEMEITLDSTWKKVLKVLKDIGVEEADIRKEGNKITISEMDPSHVSLVEAEFKPKDVEEMAEGSEEVETEKVAVDVVQLQKALKSYGRLPKVVMAVEEDRIKLESKNGSDHTITISAREPMEEELPEPDLEFEVEARANIKTPMNKVGKVFKGADNFKFAVEGGKLYIKYGSEDTLDSFKKELDDGLDEEADFTGLLGSVEGQVGFEVRRGSASRSKKDGEPTQRRVEYRHKSSYSSEGRNGVKRLLYFLFFI